MFVELRGLVAIGACGVAFPEFLTTLANLSVAFLEMQLIKRELGWGGGGGVAQRGVSCHLFAPSTRYFLLSPPLSSSLKALWALPQDLLRRIWLGESQQLTQVTR